MADITLVHTQIQDWTAVAQNTIVESAVYDMSASLEAQLQIQAFLDTETAHTGTRFIIFVSSNEAGDEDWSMFGEFIALIGTANSEAITNNPLTVGSTVITCSSTTGYTVLASWRAIEDATLPNSEIIFQIAVSANANITILDGTAVQHAQNTLMYNVAISRNTKLPASIGRLKVVVDNTYDSDGSTLNYRLRITEVTEIA